MADFTLVEGDRAVRIDFDLEDAYGPINLTSTTVTFILNSLTTSTTIIQPATGIGYATPTSSMVASAGHYPSTFKTTRASNDQFFPSNRDLAVLILPHTRARS